MLHLQQSLLAIQKRKEIWSFLCAKEVKYDCEKSLKEDKQKGKWSQRRICCVLCTFSVLSALDEWTSLKEPRLLTGNA